MRLKFSIASGNGIGGLTERSRRFLSRCTFVRFRYSSHYLKNEFGGLFRANNVEGNILLHLEHFKFITVKDMVDGRVLSRIN